MIGELLTHKNLQITRRYAKFLPDTKRQAAGVAAELINEQVAAGKVENGKVKKLKRKMQEVNKYNHRPRRLANKMGF